MEAKSSLELLPSRRTPAGNCHSWVLDLTSCAADVDPAAQMVTQFTKMVSLHRLAPALRCLAPQKDEHASVEGDDVDTAGRGA
jgi:hypothetical protein